MIVAEAMHFSSSKDKNPVLATTSYFEIIEEIWEVNYTKFRVPVFKCIWVASNTSVQTDELGFIFVDFSRVGSKEEPFILEDQAKQVFYVTDSANKGWSMVLQGRRMTTCDDNDDSSLELCETPSFLSR